MALHACVLVPSQDVESSELFSGRPSGALAASLRVFVQIASPGTAPKAEAAE